MSRADAVTGTRSTRLSGDISEQWRPGNSLLCAGSYAVPATVLDRDLHAALVKRFTDAVMQTAGLPAARQPDVQAASRFSSKDGEIVCTCSITGSTYTQPWDGSRSAAEAFAQSVGEDTADLVRRTPKNHQYAWLYAAR